VKGTLALAAFLIAAQTLPVVDPPRVTQKQFKRLRAAGRIAVVDQRAENTYRRGHIPGAISLPLDGRQWQPEFDRTLDAIKALRKPVVVYCGCAGDAGAVRVANLLTERGVRDVRVLAGGWIDWFNDGNPVVTGRGR
jgi:3-mercaptopyruvate sulfurtransferase SseA